MAAQPSAAPPPFNPKVEEWPTYMSRFRMYLEANNYQDLPDNRKRALFLTYCGPDIYRMAETLAAPTDVEAISWTSLQNILKDHYAPATIPMVSRNEFYHRRQREGETINDFVAALREIASKCEFVNTEEMMKDRIILGMRDLTLQKKLLTRRGANFKDVVDEARAAESSDNSAANVRKNSGVHRVHREPDWANEVPESDEEYDYDEGVHKVFPEGRGGFREMEHRSGRCPGCLGAHARASCRFKEAICRRCQRRGHIAEACRASQPAAYQPRPPQTGKKSYQPSQSSSKFKKRDNYPAENRGVHQTVVGYSDVCNQKKFHVTPMIEGTECEMEVDTGSFFTIMAWETLRKLQPKTSKRQLKPHNIQLVDFQGKGIPVIGRATVQVKFREFNGRLPVTVVASNRPTLLGVEWFQPLKMGITGIQHIESNELHHIESNELEKLLEEFKEVFDGTLGKYRGKPISFNLDPAIAPIRLKPRRVPFALRPKVDEQLDKLIAQGVLEPVDHAAWETPIVTPIKPDGSIRICADYKCTLNKGLQQNAYPVPVVQHLLHSLGRGKVFAKLDLAQAYQQLPVDGATAEAQTIVTHRGAFKCNRLQFGVCVAPGIFQSMMERLLHGIPGVVPYFDDVLISGENTEQLIHRLRQTLVRFQQRGLKVKKEKCLIGTTQVEFLGYLIDAAGLHPTPKKIKAIRDAPEPRNKLELQAFLGLLNFYSVFLKQKATVAEPLHRLLGKAVVWSWGQREARAFQAVKKLLSSDSVLIQYSESLPLVLTCDASPYGVGAVLSHVLPDNSEAPIAFYSKTLSPAERNYSQLDREALAAVTGIKRFHEYVYGRRFSLVTDHKPLLGLIAGDRPTPTHVSPRMARWGVFLAGYNYLLIHRPGKDIPNADALSRCPLADPDPEAPMGSATMFIDVGESSPVTSAEVATHTRKDKVLSQIVNWVLRGWPGAVKDTAISPFLTKQSELAVIKGCLVWGERVVIPESLQRSVLQTLHMGHPGIVRMKALARSYVWWPNIDKDIHHWVGTCAPCQETRAAPPKAPVREWETPSAPWSRIHIDFAGPMEGQMFLIVVDALSKWLEVIPMRTTTTDATIKVLRRLFATHGLPDIIVSDNGPQLTAKDMEVFLAGLGIRHALISPFSPASNGQAERMVRLTKETLTRMGKGDWQEKIDTFLLAQHITPGNVTNKSPAELLMGRKLRSRLDRLHPTYSPGTITKDLQPLRILHEGDLIFAKNYAGEPLWLRGQISRVTGPKSYVVLLEDGRVWRRHIDQLRKRIATEETETAHKEQEREPETPRRTEETVSTHRPQGEQRQEEPQPAHTPQEIPEERRSRQELGNRDTGGDHPPPITSTEEDNRQPGGEQPGSAQPLAGEQTELRRSKRNHRHPAHLKDYVANISYDIID